MLPHAIKGKVDETEVFISTTKNFSLTEEQKKEQREVAKAKALRKYIKATVILKDE
jgi:hypothetical protein